MSGIVYDINGCQQSPYDNYFGDGTHDDAIALQFLIDNNTSVRLPEARNIRLTQSLVIDISKLQIFDGNNSTFYVDGDFPAFVLNGTMTSGSADPSSLTDQIVKKESGFLLENCKIIGTDETLGTGIEISGCVNIQISKNYIVNLKKGIVIKNRNRDIIIADNNIYKIYDSGIEVDPTVNLHQMNIVGNMIQYCHKCIYINNVLNYANYQITGNDIEISTYPSVNLSDSRCVLVDIADNKSGYFAELIMCGNTIQGHSLSDVLIEINGGGVAKYTNITGNHISNSRYACIKLSKCNDTSISGNTFKNDTYTDENAYVLKISGCNNTALSANTFSAIGRLIDINESNNVVVTGNAGTCDHEPITQSGTNNGICIESNVVNSGKRIAVIGDSICNRGWWQAELQEIANVSFVDYSEGGTCIAKKDSSDTTYFATRVPSMDSDFDIIIVWGGVNDFGYNFGSQGGTPLGTITDSTSDTFYGALNVLCDALAEKYKEAKIAFILSTPIATLATMQEKNLPFGGQDRPNTKGFYLSQYMEAIREVCEKYSFPVLDLQKNSGFTQNNLDVMTSNLAETAPDGLHPSRKGFHHIINQLANFIENL